ncbi:hypothetical protein CVT26_012540 [Gymnopilus dilepis]|uniref:Uncharacterized protein n=1 Tax=Gymnopilus dilepis TaxID=231916 RepID=A0A409X5E0_9AGAR|nr:hypothetical protein CVT26_012540 [Gymnopilus dilepis]
MTSRRCRGSGEDERKDIDGGCGREKKAWWERARRLGADPGTVWSRGCDQARCVASVADAFFDFDILTSSLASGYNATLFNIQPIHTSLPPERHDVTRRETHCHVD